MTTSTLSRSKTEGRLQTSRAAAILGAVLCLSLPLLAEAHGRLSSPATRDMKNGLPEYQQNGPVASGQSTDFVCRSLPAAAPTTTMQVGQPFSLTWTMTALHVGDCAVYLSYDGTAPPAQQRWFKVADFPKCKDQSGQPQAFVVPSYLPNCPHCVLRWEWTALHQVTNVEYYAQCVDVSIAGQAGAGQLPSPQLTIPGHLPAPSSFRAGYPDIPSNPCFLVGPQLATAAGVANPNHGVAPCTPATGAGCTTCTGGSSTPPAPAAPAVTASPTTAPLPPNTPTAPASAPAVTAAPSRATTAAPMVAPSTGTCGNCVAGTAGPCQHNNVGDYTCFPYIMPGVCPQGTHKC